MVVETSERASRSWTVRMSTPASSRWVAQTLNPILRPFLVFPPCFSFAALVRRISRTSSFSVTSHFAGSGSRLPA